VFGRDTQTAPSQRNQITYHIINRGMILASTNPKIFSAGLDIMEMYQPKVRQIFFKDFIQIKVVTVS
jgi:hypothetical protein